MSTTVTDEAQKGLGRWLVEIDDGRSIYRVLILLVDNHYSKETNYSRFFTSCLNQSFYCLEGLSLYRDRFSA